MLGRMVMVVWLAGCTFTAEPQPGDDTSPPDMQPPDMEPPVSCSNLTCDRNATCMTTGTAACRCNQGYSGNGMTCADVDECATGNGGCQAACQNTVGSFACYIPTSCADLKARVSPAADGTYMMYLGGDTRKPWHGYCADMAGTPREYLTLSGNNTAQYTQGGASPGTDVKTTFTKVRFDPATLRIDISDRTFATSTGMLNHSGSGTMVTSMPFGVAMDCRGNNSRTGLASIDLRGTAFALANGAFIQGGNNPGSSLQPADNGRRAQLTGGGNCGWAAPRGVPPDPFNDRVTNGKLLALVYLGE